MPSIKGRTVREFQTTYDVWATADSWAQQAGYDLIEQDQVSRTYKKGVGFWVAPQMLQIVWDGTNYRLEAWIKGILINRIFTLGLIPKNTNINSGGFVAVIPRTMAREKVNILLQMLGQPPIA